MPSNFQPRGRDFDYSQHRFTPEFLDRVLAMFVQDRTWLKGFRQAVRPELLFQDSYEHKFVSAVLLDHFDRYRVPPDVVALKDALHRKKQTEEAAKRQVIKWQDILALADRMFAIDIRGSAGLARDTVVEIGQHAGLKDLLERCKAVYMGRGGLTNVDEAIRDYRAISQDRREKGSWLLREESFLARREERYQGLLGRIPLGYPYLDTLLKGGIGQEVMYVVAPYEGGKTLLTTNLARQMFTAGKKVLVFGFEEGEESYHSRIEQQLYGTSYEGLKLIPDELEVFVTELRNSLTQDIHVKFFPTETVRVRDLADYVISMREDELWSPDVVFVDGGELVLPERFRENQHQEEASIALQFKNMASAVLKIPVIVFVQAQRDAKRSKEFAGKNVAGTIKKLQVADIVLLLLQDEQEQAKHRWRIRADKARKGRRKGTVLFEADPDTGLLDELQDLTA